MPKFDDTDIYGDLKVSGKITKNGDEVVTADEIKNNIKVISFENGILVIEFEDDD